MIKIIMKKRSMALRHVLRTHRVAIDWLFENFEADDLHLRYVPTKEQVADLMTKGFAKWGTLEIAGVAKWFD